MARDRRLIGVLVLVALVAIGVGVSGVQLPLARLGVGTDKPPLLGLRAIAASTVLWVGAGAPPGGELAFLAVEPNGNLFVSDSTRRTLMRFDPSGHLLSEWGPQLGPAMLDEPAGVAVRGDSFYVLDRGTPRVFRLDSAGQLQSVFSLETFGTYGLNGLAVDLAGDIYVADTGRNRILVFAPDGSYVRQIGRAGSDLGGFTQPMMLAFAPDASFFVADWENGRIEHFDTTFQAIDAWPIGFHPFGVAIDQAGRLFVPDTDRHRVEAYSADGSTLGEIGGVPPVIDVAPKQVAVAPSGQPSVYVLGSDGIQRFDLENTPAPPQAGPSVDLVSLLVIGLMIAMVAVAVVSRRRRERRLGNATLERPVGLRPEDGAQPQQQQPRSDEDLLIAHQPKREQ